MDVSVAQRVPSATSPGRSYTVRLTNGRWECQCAGFAYRNECHHIKEVQEEYEMTQTAVAKPDNAAIVESVLMAGDLAKLSPGDRVVYYTRTCESLGLNPLTRPFEYITLNGKLTLYARRDATDQIRAMRGISIEIVAREMVNDLYIVTAKATDASRSDSSIGAVTVKGLTGEALANAIMKAETKAKRRVTLSIAGLGMLDETEVATVPEHRAVVVDEESGEIVEPKPSIKSELGKELKESGLTVTALSPVVGVELTPANYESTITAWLDMEEGRSIASLVRAAADIKAAQD